MREFKSSVKSLWAVCAVLAVAACSFPLGAPTQAANLSLVVHFPASQSRSLMAPETSRIEVTVASPSWSAPQTFTFEREAGSTQMTLTIPGVPLGDVVIDLVASGQVGTDLVALSSGHAEGKLSASNKSVSIQILPVAPVVQTEPVNDVDMLPETPSAPYIYGPAQTTFFKIAPTTPGLYRIIVAPGTTGADAPVPVAFMQIYDSDGNVAVPPRFDMDDLTFWYIHISDVSKPYYVGLRAGTGSDNGALFFDEATTAELTSLAAQTPEGDIDTTGTLVFTFPYPMDTSDVPELAVLDGSKNYIAGLDIVPVWVTPTRLEVSCNSDVGWPTGELAFYLTDLIGQGYSTPVVAGRFNANEFLFWKRQSWQSLYIDPVAGNDTNSGGPDAPLKSLNWVFSNNLNASRNLMAFFEAGMDTPVRILMAASASSSDNLLQPGTMRMEHDDHFGGIQLLGGRDPANHWARVPGAYSYLGFDGEFATDYVIQTSFDLFITNSATGNPFVMEGLFVTRSDQPDDYVTTANNTQTVLMNISSGTSGIPAIVLRDNVFDAGAVAYSKAAVGGAAVKALSIAASNIQVYRNSIRQQPSKVTAAGSSLAFAGLWLRNSGTEAGRWLVANNTVEPGGPSTSTGATGGSAIGISAVSNGPNVYLVNNTLRVEPSQTGQSGYVREGIVGESAGGADLAQFQVMNNVIVFPLAPPLFYQAYLRNGQSTKPSFTAIISNLFTTDDTDPFGPVSNSNNSSAGFYQNNYLALSVFQTLSALNTAPHSANLGSPDLLSSGAFVHPGTDLMGGFTTGGLALQGGTSATVTAGGKDLSLSMDFSVDESAILSLDRTGAPRTGNGTIGWTMGAYERD